MKMVDLKLTKEDKKATKDGCIPYTSGGPDYPYGLSLTLNDRELQKLGMDTLPKPGVVVTLEAKAVVVSVRQSANQRGTKDRSLELQLQRIALDTDADDSAEDAVRSGLKDV